MRIFSFAFKCHKCNNIFYRNTLRSANMWCDKCRKNTLVRYKKGDKPYELKGGIAYEVRS